MIFNHIGADLKEMSPITYAQNVKDNYLKFSYDGSNCKKPLIAAVNGYCVSWFPKT